MAKGNVLLAFLLVILSAGTASAQMSGPFAVGIRASPDGGGLNARYLPEEHIIIELQANTGGGIGGKPGTMGGLLVQYNAILPNPALRIFIGVGMHYGSWDRYNDGRRTITSGVDGIVGIEYILHTVPIGISADIKPAINFVSTVTTTSNNLIGLGVRYYLGSWEASVGPRHGRRQRDVNGN